MSVIALLTSVLVLGGSAPDIKIVPEGFYSETECQQRLTIAEKITPDQFDTSGRPILSTFWKCTPLLGDQVQKAAQLAASQTD